MTKPAQAAAFGAIVCTIIIVALSAIGLESTWWGALLLHASEGAAIGVLCDFIAVRKVFNEAGEKFDSLAQSLGEVVARDILKVESLLSDPHESLKTQWTKAVKPKLIEQTVQLDLRDWIIGVGSNGSDARPAASLCRVVATCMQQVADSERIAGSIALVIRNGASRLTLSDLGLARDPNEVEATLSHVWNRTPRSAVVNWMVTLDLRAELFGGGPSNPLMTERARMVIAACMREVNADESRLELIRLAALKAIPTGAWFFEKLITARKFGEFMNGLADGIERGGEANNELRQAALAYARSYLDSWHKQPVAVRAAAAESVIDAVAPTVIRHLSSELARMAPTTTLEPVADWLADVSRVQARIKSLATWVQRLPQSSSGATSGVADVAAEFALEWLEAWHDLAESVRRRAVTDLVNAFEPSLLDTLSNVAGNANGAELQRRLSQMIADRIRSSGRENLVDMLRTNAGPNLDWIKVNGLVYGALFGLVSGGFTLGLHMLRN
jgi:hypothetical protein